MGGCTYLTNLNLSFALAMTVYMYVSPCTRYSMHGPGTCHHAPHARHLYTLALISFEKQELSLLFN